MSDKYNVGIVANRIGYKAVLLHNGEYESHWCFTPTYSGSETFDRGVHLTRIVDHFDDKLDSLVDDYEALSLSIDSVNYSASKRTIAEQAQAIGALMSLPIKSYTVSYATWTTALIGVGGVTIGDVKRGFDGRFNLESRFGSDDECYTAFGLARFGYTKDELDSHS